MSLKPLQFDFKMLFTKIFERRHQIAEEQTGHPVFQNVIPTLAIKPSHRWRKSPIGIAPPPS